MIRNTLRRIRGRSRTVRNWRPSWLPKNLPIDNELHVHPHVDRERANLFAAYDAGSAEIEVLNWLYATICLTKPEKVLETGAAKGLGLIAMGSACRDNGFGKVYSVEIDRNLCNELEKTVVREGLEDWVEIVCENSMDYLGRTDHKFDLAFFDSVCEIRALEFEVCMEKKCLSNIAVFHDTSEFRTDSMNQWPSEPEHKKYRKMLLDSAKRADVKGYYENKLSRGLFVIFL